MTSSTVSSGATSWRVTIHAVSRAVALACSSSSMSPTTSSASLQRRAGPDQLGGRVGVAGPCSAQPGVEHHQRPLARVPFVVGELAIGPQAQRAGFAVRRRPDVARAPLVGPGHPVADRGAVEDAGVLILQPVVEPGERLDVEALPRPRQPELAEHPDPDDRCVGQRPHGRKRGRQVQRDVLPVAAQIGRHLNAVQQRHQVPLIPPLVAQRVLDRHRPPQVVPRVRIVVQLERRVQDSDRRLSVHRGELAVQRRRAQDVPGGVDQRAAPEPVTARRRESRPWRGTASRSSS